MNTYSVSVSTPPVGNTEATAGGHGTTVADRERLRQATPAPREVHPVGAAKPDQKLVEELADEVNQSLANVTSLSFRVDKDLDQVVVKVVDTANDQVIRQIPSENMVDLVKRMRDLQGMLFNTKA